MVVTGYALNHRVYVKQRAVFGKNIRFLLFTFIADEVGEDVVGNR